MGRIHLGKQRLDDFSNINTEQLDAILDMICKVSVECRMSFRWRPFLPDPCDDFILELAVQSDSDYIVTYNKKDFPQIDIFGLEVLTPKEFLVAIGEIPNEHN